MSIRGTKFVLCVIAAVAMGGCSSGTSYNVPADAAKEAAEIGAGAPRSKISVNNRKVTKPPGPAMKGTGVKSLND
jgi:hypothetical protein